MFSIARAVRYASIALALVSSHLLSVPSAEAVESSSAKFRNTRSGVNAGGGRKNSASFRHDGSAGGIGKSTATSAGFRARSGLQSGYHYPGRTGDLFASSVPTRTQMFLQWTSPGNDGHELSTPGAYLVRYSSIASESPAISDAKFNAATPVTPAAPAPARKGTRRTLTATGLLEGVTYYFAVKTAERDGTRSVLSAGATAQTTAPFGCLIVRNVHQVDGPHKTIQSAVDALPRRLPGHVCVIVRDGAVYPEQVTVQDFENDGSSITFVADPASGLTPTVRPPADSLAGFHIANASVNIYGLAVAAGAGPVSYGIYASSGHVRISSVSVSGASAIAVAGVSLSSWSVMDLSTVTVGDAHGVWLAGSTMTLVTRSSVTNDSAAARAVLLSDASANTLSGLFARNRGGAALQLSLAAGNAVLSSTFTADSAADAVLLTGSSSNTVADCSLRNDSTGAALRLESGSSGNLITGSFVSHAGETGTGAYLAPSADGNTIDLSVFYGAGALRLGSDGNVVIRSSITGAGSAEGLELGGAGNLVADSRLSHAAAGDAVLIPSGHGGVIRNSTVTASAAGAAVSATGGSSFTVTGSYLEGLWGLSLANSTGTAVRGSRLASVGPAGAGLRAAGGVFNLLVTSSVLSAEDSGAGLSLSGMNMGLIVVSSNTFLPGSQYGISAGTQAPGAELWFSSNTIVLTASNTRDTVGIHLDGLATGATVAFNTVVGREGGALPPDAVWSAVRVKSSRGVSLHHNRFSHPDLLAAGLLRLMELDDAEGTEARFNDFHASATVSAVLLRVAGGSRNTRLASNIFSSSFTAAGGSTATVVVDPSSLAGWSSDYNDYHSENSEPAFSWNGEAAQGLPAWVEASGGDAGSISVPPLWFDPSAGVEDFHPLSSGGRWDPGTASFVKDGPLSLTVDAGDPDEDYSLETAPNGVRVNQGSYGGTPEASRTGNFSYPGCAASFNVGAGQPYGTIAEGLSFLPASLSGHTCLVIRDNATYAEAVTVSGFETNGSSISIFTAAGKRATVAPAAPAAAAFRIANSSVNLFNLDVRPAAAVAYGIDVAGPFVKVSSVHVADPGGKVSQAGVRLGSSWDSLSHSTVTVGSAHGVRLASADWATVSYTSATSAAASFAALSLSAASSCTVTRSVFSNPLGNAVLVAGGGHNSLSLSSALSDSPGAALSLSGSSHNGLSRMVLSNPGGDALRLSGGAAGNLVELSTISSDGSYGLRVQDSSSNTVLSSYIQGPTAAYLTGSVGTALRGSVLAAAGATGAALRLAGASENLLLEGSALLARPDGLGLGLEAGNLGVVSLGSVTVSGPARGVELSAQAPGFTLAVDSLTFAALAPGATAIRFLGGTFVTTFTAVHFADPGIGTDVSAAALSLASRVTMRGSKGPVHGPEFEVDPNEVVDWPDIPPPSAVTLYWLGTSSAALRYGLVGADGYMVQASTRPDFPAGVVVSSTVFGQQDHLELAPLMPNTTYYLRSGALWSGATVYAKTVISTPTLAELVTGLAVDRVDLTTMTLSWFPLPLSPPDASSKTAEGYLLEASSEPDFSVVWSSSFTANPAVSSLTLDTLRGGVTYYLRLGTLNLAGAPNWTPVISTHMPVQLGAELSTHTLSLPGLTDMNATVLITTSVVVTNTGNVRETYWVRAATVTPDSPWRIDSVPGLDRFTLSMLVSGARPSPGSFGAEDRLADAEQSCTSLVFAFGGNCVRVPVGETRKLWFKLDTPVVTSTAEAQDIRIFVRAVRDPDPDPNR